MLQRTGGGGGPQRMRPHVVATDDRPYKVTESRHRLMSEPGLPLRKNHIRNDAEHRPFLKLWTLDLQPMGVAHKMLTIEIGQ